MLCIRFSQLLNACSVTHSSKIYKNSVVKTKGRLIVNKVVLFLIKYAVTVMACL